jgi:hypothetical protein
VLPVALWWLDATGRFPAWLETEGIGNLPILCAGAVAATLTLTVGWLRIGRGWTEIRDTRLVNWITVTVASVAVAAGAYWLTIAYATADLVLLLAESIAALVFLVVWATLLWWLPERVHRAPRIDDDVIRAPLA